MDKEKVYHLKDYNISYDIGSGDQSSLVIAKFLNGTIYVLETFYNEQATLLATILDGFQLESKRLANQNEALCDELELLKQKYVEIANLLHEKYFEGNCPKIIDIFDKLNKVEIERLNKELQDTKENLGEYLHEQEEENNRLNNIINELERKLLSTYSTYVSMDKVPTIAKYIRELKGEKYEG